MTGIMFGDLTTREPCSIIFGYSRIVRAYVSNIYFKIKNLVNKISKNMI